jgi:hypothetical protein
MRRMRIRSRNRNRLARFELLADITDLLGEGT